jgi:hypothetical protein
MQPVSLTRSPELISGTIFTTVQAEYRVFSFPPLNIITAASTTLYTSRGVVTLKTPEAVSLVATHSTAFKRFKWQW